MCVQNQERAGNRRGGGATLWCPRALCEGGPPAPGPSRALFAEGFNGVFAAEGKFCTGCTKLQEMEQ